MTRSIIRTLAAPAALALLLAGCGTSDDTVEGSPTTDVQQEASDAGSDAGGADDSDDPRTDDGNSEAWPELDDAEENGYYSQGQYLGMNSTGTGFIMDIPAEGPEDIEAFREKVGGDEMGYIKVEIDNTDGTEKAGVTGAVLVDTDGEEYFYESAFSVIGDWQSDAEDFSTDEYNESVDLYNAYLDDEARPTAKKTAWLLGPAVPERMSYIELDSPMETMEPQPLT